MANHLMRPEQRILVRILREVCDEAGIQLTALSDHWILRLQKQGRIRDVYGFNFDINTASAYLLANDKFATYTLLRHCGVPAIEHRMFQRPVKGPALISAADWQEILDFFAQNNQNIVCKMNLSSGGLHVLRARSESQLHRIVTQLLTESRSICLSPFVPILNEYRVFIYRHEPLLIYRKERAFVLGDGQQTLAELIQAKYAPGSVPALPDLDHIPAPGEKMALNWKHNLGQGAHAHIVEEKPLAEVLASLAIQSAQALGICFASIDIVESAGSYAVLEVNAGIMMESFAAQGEKEYALAKSIYQRAVLDMLDA